MSPLKKPLVTGQPAGQVKLPSKWQSLVLENGSYKLVALVVTLI